MEQNNNDQEDHNFDKPKQNLEPNKNEQIRDKNAISIENNNIEKKLDSKSTPTTANVTETQNNVKQIPLSVLTDFLEDVDSNWISKPKEHHGLEINDGDDLNIELKLNLSGDSVKSVESNRLFSITNNNNSQQQKTQTQTQTKFNISSSSDSNIFIASSRGEYIDDENQTNTTQVPTTPNKEKEQKERDQRERKMLTQTNNSERDTNETKSSQDSFRNVLHHSDSAFPINNNNNNNNSFETNTDTNTNTTNSSTWDSLFSTKVTKGEYDYGYGQTNTNENKQEETNKHEQAPFLWNDRFSEIITHLRGKL